MTHNEKILLEELKSFIAFWSDRCDVCTEIGEQWQSRELTERLDDARKVVRKVEESVE